MKREELLQLIQLKEELVPSGRPNRPGIGIKPSKITIHNTSNASPGADAKMHSAFVRNTGFYITKDPKTGVEKKNWVSWHFSVDDKVAIQQIPVNEKAFHAGTAANETSIAIEICMNKGIQQELADERAARLAALLCYDLSIPPSGVVAHQFWTGKNCPVLLLKSWKLFLAKVEAYVRLLQAETMSDIEGQIPLCWNEELNLITDMVPGWEAPAMAVSLEGFNQAFLPAGEVGLPVITGSERHVFLHHQNLSIYFDKDRKLAFYTACNYDKDAFFPELDRSDSFRNDGAIDASLQLGKGFYGSATLDLSKHANYFDRGHLIARRYNQWGVTLEEAKKGERDTYYFTTIHPQVQELNKDEWESLETFIIERGKLDVRRVSIIAGAFLWADDPVATYIDKYYQEERTIQVPLVYWKLVFYEVAGSLRKIAFLMSQKQRLQEIPFVSFNRTADLDPADPFFRIGENLKMFITHSSLIESAAGIRFTEAEELYDKQEPLEVVIEKNDTLADQGEVRSNIARFI